jgi:hypothetical protein
MSRRDPREGFYPVVMTERWESGVTARAAEVASLDAALHRAFASRDGSPAANKTWIEAAAAFRSAVEAFYAPYDEVLAGVRAGQTDAIEMATRFLVADPWCFRSGYLKAELMHALANAPLPPHVVEPLRKVVLKRIVDPQPRLLRYAAQLAASLWDEDFEAQVTRLELAGSTAERLAAGRLASGARQRIRSRLGQASDDVPKRQ